MDQQHPLTGSPPSTHDHLELGRFGEAYAAR